MKELTREEQDWLDKYRQGFRGVLWHIDDFEQQAQVAEEPTGLMLFDRTKFQEVLESMIQHHDCNIGITWDTIDFYLDEYCLLKEEKDDTTK